MSSYTNFTVETDADGIALVTWNMPDKSMNVFTVEVMNELDAIVDADRRRRRRQGRRLHLRQVDLLRRRRPVDDQGHVHDPGRAEEASTRTMPRKSCSTLTGRMTGLFRKLETCGKPWVSAINGTCMGGAFELSLACHGRVAANSKSVKLALPEVKVGIFPGAGGTQRVPRLTNAQDALQMMTTGSSLTPQRAKAMGLVHEIAEPAEADQCRQGDDQERPEARPALGRKGLQGSRRRHLDAGRGPALAGRLRPSCAARPHGNYPGGLAILKCVYEGLQVPFDTGLKIEQRYFTEILQTTEAFSMIRSLFISMQELGKGARRPAGVPKSDLKQIGVVGAGFMGASIAYVAAAAGIAVTLIDRDMEAATKGKAHSEGLVKDSIGKGRLTQDEARRCLRCITPSADYTDLKDVKLVVEAVFEDRQVKKDVIEKVEAVLAEDAIFASNTSTLPITGLAKNSKRPAQFIGIHFFSPVEKMMLTEVILGKETGDKALATALDFVAAIKKTPIVVNDTRGFYVNRCVFRYIHEAYDMLIEGVPAAMIENAAKMAGMPVGPLSLNDEVAIDLSQKILKASIADLGEASVDPRHMALINKLVDDLDRRGRKNGKGFYDYPAKPAKKYALAGPQGPLPAEAGREASTSRR